MGTVLQSSLQPRKKPIQTRSARTVEAIFEATIQVLLRHGAEQFTTTRVAERAGVSVGTLYQYYPNKQSLLFAVLERHLNLVIRAWNARAEKIIIGLWRRWWLPLFTPTSVLSWIKQTHR